MFSKKKKKSFSHKSMITQKSCFFVSNSVDVTRKQVSVLQTEEDSPASLLLCPHASSAVKSLSDPESLGDRCARHG